MRDYKSKSCTGLGHLNMATGPENLLEAFKDFEVDLEVDEILEKVKVELALDDSVEQFGERLKEREEEKRVAQTAREALVKEKWTPGHYPQLTCEWFVEGLDFCCDYWRYQFKRPFTPPPAPPPSPDAWRKRAPPHQTPSQTPSQLPRKRRR